MKLLILYNALSLQPELFITTNDLSSYEQAKQAHIYSTKQHGHLHCNITKQTRMEKCFQTTKKATYYSVKQHHYFSKTNIQQQSFFAQQPAFYYQQCYDFSRPTHSVSYTTVTEDPSMTKGRRRK